MAILEYTGLGKSGKGRQVVQARGPGWQVVQAGYWATLGKPRQVRYVPILEYRLLAARLSKYRQMALVGILE